MTLFESLFVAHLLGDWLFQTEWMALNKNKKVTAMVTHLVIYHLFILGVLGWHFSFSNLSIYVVLLLMIVVHALLDLQWTVLAIIKFLRITVKREPEKWIMVAVDQTLHILLLAAVTIYLSR